MALTVEPVKVRFKGGQGEAFRAALEKADRVSELVPVGPLDELLMRPDGRLAGGLRFTPWGLYQLGRLACPGLYRLLRELSDGLESPAAAADVYNRVVRLRYRDALSGQVWLVDRSAGTVEAVVSPKYRFLHNLELYAQVEAAAAGTGFQLAEAEVYGRWLMVRVYHPDPLFRALGDTYHRAVHFSNHEGGQASVRGAPVVVRARGLLAFAPPPMSTSVRHSGAEFTQRVGLLVAASTEYAHPAASLAARVETLAKEPLGLGLPSEAAEDARRAAVVRRLASSRQPCLPWSLAARILAGAILQPHDAAEPRSHLAVSSRDLQALTVWDLTVSACREARRLPIATRERVDRMAHALLSGRVRMG